MAARPELVREAVRRTLERVPISIAEKIRDGARTFKEAGGTEAYFGSPIEATHAEGEASYEALAQMLATTVIEALAAEDSAQT